MDRSGHHPHLHHGLSAIEEDFSGDGSSTNLDLVEAEKTPKKRRPKKKDEKLVLASRAVVVGVLMLSALLIAFMTYYIVAKDEYEDFKAEFEASATQVLQMATKNIDHIFDSVETLAHTVTSAAHQSGATLPMVTIEDFEGIGRGTRSVSKASILAYSPLLTTKQALREWNAYAANHSYWIEQGREQGEIMTEQSQEDSKQGHGDEQEHGGEEHGEHEDEIEGEGHEEGQSDEHGNGHDKVKIDEETSHNHAHARRAAQEAGREDHPPEATRDEHHVGATNIEQYVFDINGTDGHHVATEAEIGHSVSPLWQMSPAPNETDMINFNLASNAMFEELLSFVVASRKLVLSKLLDAHALFGHAVDESSDESPASILLHPVFAEVGSESVVGTVAALIKWKDFLNDVLSSRQFGIIVVADICGEKTTFSINGANAEFVGAGDQHDRKYSSLEKFMEFGFEVEVEGMGVYCHQHLHLYPTRDLEASFQTTKPRLYAFVIVCMFAFTGIVFLSYDWFVSNRQQNTEAKANKSNDILHELFPESIAQQLFESKKSSTRQIPTESFEQDVVGAKTIAELYPAATVLFADIAGFTAWSSMKDPDQVFKLLESIFQAFDNLAKRRGIYKVETIGDCYMAVCGVPKPDPDHAVHMARFAMSAMKKFYQIIVSDLQLTLGPDTVDLGMRFGMHSGPVTAGVLRGDRARFQLFGDTVNTASRIESTGMRERIHLSEQTALELIKHGKQDWIERRQDAVEAKGKGKLVTYWLTHTSDKRSPMSVVSSSDYGGSELSDSLSPLAASEIVEYAPAATKQSLRKCVNIPRRSNKEQERIGRLVDWNSELLLRLLKRVVARRDAMFQASGSSLVADGSVVDELDVGSTITDEQMDIIEMQPYVAVPFLPTPVEISDKVATQLHAYVARIAALYHDNPFHNFEHASHVTMSVHKLLSRLVTSQTTPLTAHDLTHNGDAALEQERRHHEQTYGISSDPLVQFAVVLAALIHDLDHAGVSNAQLMAEQPALGERYQGQSVAEQNSLDMAWNALVSTDTFAELRNAIFTNTSELRRFRQVLVNSVRATDIFDPELAARRKERWNLAFATKVSAAVVHDMESAPIVAALTKKRNDSLNRKATIVVEHLIQASDVAHTMQHWHVYQKWNQRLFNEMYQAYMDGRAEIDPSIGWYNGELGFLDHYIIPLAHKLKECGVFGVSSDEYLTYALDNRREWAEKGQDIVAKFVQDFDTLHTTTQKTSSRRVEV